MNENSLISKSERNSNNQFIIYGGIVMLMFFIFLVKYNFHPKNIYEEQTKIFGIAFLVLVILYCIYYLLSLKTIYVLRIFLQ